MIPFGKAENRGILSAMMIFILFILFWCLILAGIFLLRTKGDFYMVLKGELDRGLLLSAFFALLFSSILYIPFSYGVSHYFLLAQKGDVSLAAIFFLFGKPKLFLKALAVAVVKKILIYLEGLMLLLLASLSEVGLFFASLLISGEDLFNVAGNPFLLAADFMLRSPLLIGLSVVLWMGVLMGSLVIRLRYILCKYVLLCYPDASPRQAIAAGRLAFRGRLWRLLYFYLRYGALFLLNAFSFGASERLGEKAARRSFSAYAALLAKEGFRNYCRKRSLQSH